MFARLIPLLRMGLAGALSGGLAVLLVVANRPDLRIPPNSPPESTSLADEVVTSDCPAAEVAEIPCELQPIAADQCVELPCRQCNVIPASYDQPAESDSNSCEMNNSQYVASVSHEYPVSDTGLPPASVLTDEKIEIDNSRASAFVADTSQDEQPFTPPRRLSLPIAQAIQANGALDQPTTEVPIPVETVDAMAPVETEPASDQSELVVAKVGSALSRLEQLLQNSDLPELAGVDEPRRLEPDTSIAKVDLQVPPATRPNANRQPEHDLPSTHQRCVIRDPETTDPVLTVTIPGRVETSAIDPDELQQKRAVSQQRSADLRLAQAKESRVGAVPKTPDGRSYVDSSPQISVRIAAEDGRIFVDVCNAELADLLAQLSEQSGIPIAHSPSTTGAITAKFSADNLTDALRRLLEPFAFDVVEQHGTIVVSRVGEEYAVRQRQPANSPMRTAIAEPLTSHANVYPLTGFPPPPQMAPADAISQASFAVSTSAEATVEPTAGIAQLAAAESPPSPRPEPPTPQQVRAAQMEMATVHIAEVAQEAFSVDKREYAVQVLTEGIIRYPQSSLLTRLLGEGYLLNGDLPAAEEALKRAIALDKSDLLAYHLMATTLQKMGQPQRAEHYQLQAKMNHGATQ